MNWNQEAAEKLFRYEALIELFEALGRTEDIDTIVKLLGNRWKYCTSIAGWQLVIADKPDFKIIQYANNTASSKIATQLPSWAANFWPQIRPYSFMPGEAPIDLTVPYGLHNDTEILVLPLTKESGDNYALLTANARAREFTNLDRKFMAVLAARASERIHDIQLREKATSLLLHKASHDALTQILNRGAVIDQINKLIRLASRTQECVSVVLIDIDHFKLINDTYGHQAGDAVLTDLANRLRRDIRANEIIGRYGGEEILIGLYPSDQHEALTTAERLRRLVADTPFALPNGQGEVKVTISLGVASCQRQADADTSDLIHKADNALYRAKENGRNKVELG